MPSGESSEVAVGVGWEPDTAARFLRRWGRSPEELNATGGENGCPDIWELDNGDVAVVGRDLTDHYRTLLPADARVGPGERVVVIPRRTMLAARADIPDV
ncbi:hypothetical protein [Dactylosporangium sp. CA-233914]|uniref:hypothetical protein n=1 Tax=Dactylosporangium sp. CA-233914 TaxID=3239934 RepID=UPI003D8DA5F1